MRIDDRASGKSWFSKRRKRFDVSREPREFTFSCYHINGPALADFLQRVWSYVLMPEHVHLLVSPRKPKLDLGRFNGFVKEHTARPAIQWLKDSAPIPAENHRD